MLEYDGIGGLIDMNDVGEDLSKVIVDIVIELPIGLAEEVPIKHELIDIYEQLLAYALE